MERKYKCNICGERDNEAEFACLYGAPRCPECNSMEVSEDKITSGDINQNIIKGMYTGQNGPDKFRKDCEKLFATGTNLNSDQLQTIWDKVCENPFFSDVSVGLFVRYQEFFFFAHEILAQVNVPASSPAKDTNPEIVTQRQDDVRFMFDND